MTTQTEIFSFSNQPLGGGGRVASDRHHKALAMCEDFAGLEQGVNHYDLLLLVKKIGREAGFTPRMIHLLEYYMMYTRDIDWEQGSRPIVYQSLSRTALDLNISERMVQKLEKALFEAGAISWHDSGNHKRYGQRDAETGHILYAFGVELTPLAYLKPMLEEKLHEKQLYQDAWTETKRQISWYRSQIRGLLLQWQEEGACSAALREFDARYQEIAIQIRTHLDLPFLRTLLARHKSLHSEVMETMGVGDNETKQPTQRQSMPEKTTKGSCRGEQKFVHYKYTTQQPFNKLNTSSPTDKGYQESVAAGPEHQDDRAVKTDRSLQSQRGDIQNFAEGRGLEHITLKQALNAASSRFLDHMPMQKRPMNWNDFVEAAYKLKDLLGVSQQSWSRACVTLSRGGAAICLLLTDQAAQRDNDPVRKPAAYFNAMISRAEKGELHLHKSVFGLLKREPDDVLAASNH